MMIEPSESAFYDPASWKDSELLLVIGTQDDLKMNAAILSHPFQELAAIPTIPSDEPQLLAGASQVSKQKTSAIPVLDRGGSDNHRQQQSHGVNQDMVLRTIDLLACIGSWMLVTTCRISNMRSRPPDFAGGINGSIISYWLSVRSVW